MWVVLARWFNFSVAKVIIFFSKKEKKKEKMCLSFKLSPAWGV
jgi:hypothetical protein